MLTSTSWSAVGLGGRNTAGDDGLIRQIPAIAAPPSMNPPATLTAVAGLVAETTSGAARTPVIIPARSIELTIANAPPSILRGVCR